MRHIPEEELHAYLDQALSRSQCVEIESHLAQCPGCQATRDAIAALRDRTTGLLSVLAPAPRIPPSWASLEARAAAARARSRRRFRHAAWAASLAAAVAAGWMVRDLTPAPVGSTLAGEATPAPPAVASTQPLPSPVARSEPEPPAPAGRRAGPVDAAPLPPPPPPDTGGVPLPAAMALRASDGVPSDFPLAGVWRTVSFDRLLRDSSEWVPRVDGLPVMDIRVSQRSEGGLSVVSQQLASGQTIRTVAGPASDVRSLVSNRPGQSASAQLQVDPAVGGRPEGDRLLVILGDIPADSLKAMLLRVR